MSGLYWNKTFETMPPEQLRQIQFKRFKNIFTYAYNNSVPYRELYDSCNISPDSLLTLDDIKKVPIISKQFITDSLDGNSLYGRGLTVPEEDVVFFHQTSGTTSAPVPQPDTRTDWYHTGECWAASLWAHGVRPADRVMIAFNYNLFIGFWQAHYGCEKLGAEIIPGGGLSTQVKLQKIRDLKVTTLITTPSYAFRIAEEAERTGYDMRASGVRRIITSGEPGGLVGGIKAKLSEMWDAEVFDNVGATEIGGWGFECTAHSGGTHINESMFLPELIEMESEAPITEPNRYGRLVFTNFFRLGRPCIRFNTNDIACWSDEPCPCGRTYRTLKGGIQGRKDYILKVRGTFINPVVIEDCVNKLDKCSQEYNITIHEDGKSVSVTAEAARGVCEEEFDDIAFLLAKRIHDATFVRMETTIVPFGSMQRYESKSKRLTDLRKREEPQWKMQT